MQVILKGYKVEIIGIANSLAIVGDKMSVDLLLFTLADFGKES